RFLLLKWEKYQGWFDELERDPTRIIAVWQQAWEELIQKMHADLSSNEQLRGLMNELRDLAATRKGDIFHKAPDAYDTFCATSDPHKIFEIGKNLAGINTNTYKATMTSRYLPIWVEKRKFFNEFPDSPKHDKERTALTVKILTSLGRITNQIHEKVVLEKEHRGVLDFDDLIRKTRDLIKNEEIRKTLNDRYRYILVDEVQDNDPTLTEIIQILCGDPRENNRLFIVGDVKQSIYLFRGADVSGFNDFQKAFPKAPVELDRSFRTVPEIVGLVNHVFKTVFADPKERWDAGYGELTAQRSQESGSVTVIRLQAEKKEKVEISMRRETEALASWIYDAVTREKLTVYEKDGTTRPAGFGDVAILIEARTHIDKLRHALGVYGVPYTEEKGYSFYEKQEVFDFTNLLKAIVYPEQDIPLYGVLRSPYFGISDAELCAASGGNGGPLIRRLKQYASAEPNSKVSRAVSELSRWNREIREEPFVPFLRRLIAESGILAVYGGLAFGREAAANLEKLVHIARNRSSSRPFSVYEFLTIMDTCMEEEFNEREGVVTDERDDRVKILTVHSSKGLEYPVLVLCFAGKTDDLTVSGMMFDEKLGAGIPVKLPGEEKGKSVVIECLKSECKKKKFAERKRLFYVGMTRARDHLVICGTDGNKGPGSNSFLSMYDEGIGGYPYPPETFTEKIAEPKEQSWIRPKAPEGWCGQPMPKREEEKQPKHVTATKRRSTPSAAEESAMLRGTMLHEIFDGIPADAAAKRYGASPEAGKEFAEKYAAFLASPIMQNVQKSYSEQQVAFSFEGTPLYGVIDRLVQYADGRWMIIDYKTGSPAKKEMELYEGQLAVYFLWAKNMFGTDPGVCLYLADKNEVRVVEMDEERAKGIVKKRVGCEADEPLII
ncbi:MAG TPA: UvrD-helicase domain-containing protein, partial [Methanocorpusculum sp.]|nr:UvrD-helicase domain-containing protein [Methanocorpusculum sp.]